MPLTQFPLHCSLVAFGATLEVNHMNDSRIQSSVPETSAETSSAEPGFGNGPTRATGPVLFVAGK